MESLFAQLPQESGALAPKDPPLFTLQAYVDIVTKQSKTLSTSGSAVAALTALLPSQNDEVTHWAKVALVAMAKVAPNTEENVVAHLKSLFKEPADMFPHQYAVLCELLALYSPLYPQSVSAVYTLLSCKDAFLYLGLHLHPELAAEDAAQAVRLLRAVALSCIDEANRKFNTQHFLPLLVAACHDEQPVIVSHALLCVVKLWSFSAVEKHIPLATVVAKLSALLSDLPPDSEAAEPALEALLYLSLSQSTRKLLRVSEGVLDQMAVWLDTAKDPALLYGLLLVYGNLSLLPAQDAASAIRNMAPGGLGNSASESPEEILPFNKDLTLSQKVPASICAAKNQLPRYQAQAITVLHNLVLRQPPPVVRALLAQGALAYVLKFLVSHSKLSPDKLGVDPVSLEATDLETRISALRLLAELVRHTDPRTAFSLYDPKLCVPFLAEILGQTSPGFPKILQRLPEFAAMLTTFEPWDTLCALAALTNLALLPDQLLHAVIISRTFESVSTHLIDTAVPEIQKAAWELVSNLILSPTMLAKFFNPDNPASRRQLEVLVNLLHSKDEALQVVIGGLLANATMDYDMVTESIISQTSVFKRLLEIACDVLSSQTGNHPLAVRVLTLLYNMSCVRPSALADAKLGPAVKKATRSDDEDTRKIAAELVRILKL